MSNGVFAVSLVIGAALLAFWVNVRFPLRDLTVQRIVGHAIAVKSARTMVLDTAHFGAAGGDMLRRRKDCVRRP